MVQSNADGQSQDGLLPYVLPILMFGSVSPGWTVTKKWSKQLGAVHSDCLWQILGLHFHDHYRLTAIRAWCGTVSLAEMLTAGRLRWLVRACVEKGSNEAAQSGSHV